MLDVSIVTLTLTLCYNVDNIRPLVQSTAYRHTHTKEKTYGRHSTNSILPPYLALLTKLATSNRLAPAIIITISSNVWVGHLLGNGFGCFHGRGLENGWEAMEIHTGF